jgi:hypothetical protein
MKRAIILIIFVLIISINNILHAQNHFRFELSSGYSWNLSSGTVISNWGNGLILGGGIVYQMFPSFDIALDCSYQRYTYNGSFLQLATPTWIGWHYSSSGHGLNTIEYSIVIRNSQKHSTLFPIFSFRVGVIHENIGEITISSWSDLSPDNISHGIYSGTGIKDNKAFAALGIGLNVPITDTFRAMIESRITQTLDREHIFVPFVLTLQFDLK